MVYEINRKAYIRLINYHKNLIFFICRLNQNMLSSFGLISLFFSPSQEKERRFLTDKREYSSLYLDGWGEGGGLYVIIKVYYPPATGGWDVDLITK